MEINAKNSCYKLQRNIEVNSVKKSLKSEVSFTPEQLQRKKSIHPRSPHVERYAVKSCITEIGGTPSRTISMTLGQTPPAKRYHKIRNPFEAALTDRLHLPLIASPSLFQQPVTPQMSSTKFEWTIDEVSSLLPVNVEPHETQFQDSPDPDLEAKAQLAIKSYFRHHKVVPSPVNCPLRNSKNILVDILDNTAQETEKEISRDCGSQTELTLPPKLPQYLQEVLQPYFQPQLAGTHNDSSTSRSLHFSHTVNEFGDVSLRRKLFDMNNVLVVENNAITCTENNPKWDNTVPVIMGKLSDSLDKSSTGSFSPISTLDSISPMTISTTDTNDSMTNRRKCITDFFKEEDVQLSPIHLGAKDLGNLCKDEKMIENISPNVIFQNILYKKNAVVDGKFTPERSSSPLEKNQCHSSNMMNTSALTDFSSDSFNIKISRLKVNTGDRQSTLVKNTSKYRIFGEDISNIQSQECTIDIIEDNNLTMENVQNTPQENLHNNSLSNVETTPRSRHRSISRKNLSQSFTNKWVDSQYVDIAENNGKKDLKENVIERKDTRAEPNKHLKPQLLKPVAPVDSGFTEMSSTDATFTDEGMLCNSAFKQNFRIYT